MISSWKFWAVLASIGGLVGLFIFGFTTNPRLVKSPLVGKPAPDFTITRLGGTEQITLSELRGTPVILNFWASWCAACRDEAPVFKSAHQRYEIEGRKLRVIGIAIQDTEEKAMGFAKRFGKKYFLGMDSPEGDISLNYGLYGVPETFFIDVNGIINYKHIGAVTYEDMEKQVQVLLSINKMEGQ